MLSHTQYRHTYRHRHHNLHQLAKGRRQEHKCVGKCAVSPVERITENDVAIDRGKPHLLWGMHAGAGHSISLVYHYTVIQAKGLIDQRKSFNIMLVTFSAEQLAGFDPVSGIALTVHVSFCQSHWNWWLELDVVGWLNFSEAYSPQRIGLRGWQRPSASTGSSWGMHTGSSESWALFLAFEYTAGKPEQVSSTQPPGNQSLCLLCG